MEKEFVPYELALRMKTLGFDEPCFAYQIKYQKPIIQIKVKNSKLEKQALIYRNTYKGVSPIKITLPTFSQAFRWFRNNYKLNAQIAFCEYSILSENSWKYTLNNPTNIQIWNGKFSTYEEAELACLRNLIKIAKGGNNDKK
jgi:hypothetical protein